MYLVSVLEFCVTKITMKWNTPSSPPPIFRSTSLPSLFSILKSPRNQQLSKYKEVQKYKRSITR